MCGIIALYTTSQTIKESSVLAGLKMLHHRGPEHQQHWISENRKTALGHTRLSIIDLDTGNQPISNYDQTQHITVNGEFYDYKNIREKLIKKGYQFKTSSDSEIALHLYAEYGSLCLQYLRGEFAFCLWDNNNKLLFAARDRFGIKPLFYAQHNDIIYLSSEIKAILAAGVPAVWDIESYRSRGFIYRDKTLFKNIHQVPPGHYLIASSDGIKIVKYWDFEYPIKGEPAITAQYTEEDIVNDIRESITESIKLRLHADVPIGVYLSGGIDSSAVLGIAAKYHGHIIDAFTLSFEDEDYNEALIAEETAKFVGANFHPIRITQSDLADHFSDAIWHAETSCINAHGVAKYLLSKAVNQAGYKVVLTGEGADEIFAGYPPFIQDDILYNHPKNENLIKQLYAENKISSGSILASEVQKNSNTDFLFKLFGFIPSWLIPQLQMIENYTSLYRNEFKDGSSVQRPLWQFLNSLDLNNQISKRDPVHISMYLMSKSLLPNYILTNLGDRMEMAHSVEGRTPFLDHHLVEKIVKLPVSKKIYNMTEKFILREAVRPFISKTIYSKKKHPFLAPPSILNSNEKLYQFARDTFNSINASYQPFFDINKVLTYMDNILSKDTNTQISAEPILMEILSLCVLQHRYSLG